MKILVTGASGFIGRHLVQSLIDEGYDVSILSRTNTRHFNSQSITNVFEVDLRSPFRFDGMFDFIFHLAAHNITHTGDADVRDYNDVNVEGTKNLLQSIDCSNFIFLSTANVYDQSNSYICERSKLSPSNDYEESKLKGEAICQDNCGKSKLFIFRSVNVIGPGQEKKALIPILFDRALNNEVIDIFVPPETLLYFIYIDDVVNFFHRLIKNSYQEGLYNLLSGTPITIHELVDKILKICNSKSNINCSNYDEAQVYRMSTSKLKAEFQWEAKNSIDFILDEYYRSLVN